MIFFKEQFATVWGVEDKGKYSTVRLSTSEKKLDGTYENSNWFATFVGNAHGMANKLQEKDRIKINGKVTNITKAIADGTKKTYLNLVVWDIVDDSNQPPQDGFGAPPEIENEEDDLPF